MAPINPPSVSTLLGDLGRGLEASSAERLAHLVDRGARVAIQPSPAATTVVSVSSCSSSMSPMTCSIRYLDGDQPSVPPYRR
jgi:hypothetical protein